MKTIPKIILQKGGTNAYEERKVLDIDGKEISEKHELTTGYIIRSLIENSQYKNAKEQHEAFKIYDKIQEDSDQIQLEDAEFELVNTMAHAFKPFFTGITFIPFFDLLDTVSKS